MPRIPSALLGALLLVSTAASAAPGKFPPPPYKLTANIFYLTYLVPAERLAKAIPEELELYTFLGKAPLIVVGARYLDNVVVKTGEKGPNYDEIVYMTVVRRNGELGSYYLKLYLNSMVARDIGRELYGFPKDFARATSSDDGSTIKITMKDDKSGSLLADVSVRRMEGIFGAIVGAYQEFATRLSAFYMRSSFFASGKTLKSAVMTSTPAAGSGRPATVERARFPLLERQGLLSASEATLPFSGVVYDNATIDLGAPRDIGSLSVAQPKLHGTPEATGTRGKQCEAMYRMICTRVNGCACPSCPKSLIDECTKQSVNGDSTCGKQTGLDKCTKALEHASCSVFERVRKGEKMASLVPECK